jgi:hypothetical protein
MADLSFEERQSVPATTQLSEKNTYKKVEHGATQSTADTADLMDPIKRQSFSPELQTHVIKGHLDCEATHSMALGHSGPATHFVQLQGESEDQQTPVCDAHLGKIIENSVSRGEYGVSKRRIHPEDVGKFAAWRGVQEREKRTYLERALYNKGMRGEDALFGRKSEELGKGGGERSSHIEEVNARRTPEEQASTLERALERARTSGGHYVAEPTIDVDGTDMTLGESNAYVSSLRRKVDPEVPGARKGNTKNYYLAGVKSPDGSSESKPTSTRRFGINKAGAPNPKGGRKKKVTTEAWDTSNENLPGYTEAEMAANPEFRKSHEERAAAGIPVEGIRPRGFSKTNNRRIEATLTGLEQEAPEVGIIERFASGREARQSKKVTSTMAMNTEAERLRNIEANKNAAREARSAAFEVGKNPNV